jgi:methylated-DNA-[protein]-cysteine S-methyltransferase
MTDVVVNAPRVRGAGSDSGAPLRESRYASPIGALVVFWGDAGVRALVFVAGRGACVAQLQRQRVCIETPAVPLPAEITAALEAYFGGDPKALDAVPLDLTGTPFQRRAWAAMRRIPPGRVLSYGALAQRLGTPNGARAVGRSAATNPVSLIVPCHRVVGSGGGLTGYLWGLERKRWLLAHEAEHGGAKTDAGTNRSEAQFI